MPDPLDPSRTTPAAQEPSATNDGPTAATSNRATAGEFTLGNPANPGEVGVLGPYRVLKELGKGGMGAVYLALDTRLSRKLALKVMLPEFAADVSAKERFLREARAAGQITHDNVVTVYDADERDGVPYIAMQFLQGYPLDEYLKKKGAPPLPHVIRIARETAAGLGAAHALGLVHRDIKPANLWLETPNGRVKVLDFGLAKPIGSDAEITKSGAVVGTPAYMSPEQARGVKVDHRTDLFSLGAVMYRLCTGQNPFSGANVMAVLMALGSDDPTPVRELNPNVPQALAALIHQLLAKKPDDRPQTAAEVAKRLRAIAEQLVGGSAAVAAAEPPVPMATSADISTSMPVIVHPAPVQPPVVSQMHVTANPESAFENLDADDEDTVAEPATAKPKPEKKPAAKGGKGMLIAASVAVLLACAAVAVVVSQLGKKDDPVAENKQPEGEKPGPKGVNPADALPAKIGPVGTGWVDLLALDEKLAETFPGHAGWVRRDGKWTSQKGANCTVILPLRATGSYKLNAEITLDDGNDYFGLILPVGREHTVSFGLNGFGGTVRGFQTINGFQTNSEPNPSRIPQTPIPARRAVMIALVVTLTGDQVELRGAVDNETPIRWTGPVASVRPGGISRSFPSESGCTLTRHSGPSTRSSSRSSTAKPRFSVRSRRTNRCRRCRRSSTSRCPRARRRSTRSTRTRFPKRSDSTGSPRNSSRWSARTPREPGPGSPTS